jgi:hypothetical protein
MKTDSKWKYLLLGIGAFLVVIVLFYLRVASSFNIPLVSLLPSIPFMKNAPAASHTPGVGPKSVERYTSPRGIVSYIVIGKFITTPTLEQNILRSDFVIDEDPTGHKIPVVMDHTEYFAEFPGSIQGVAVWKRQVAQETISQSIKVNVQAQLRILSVSSPPAPYDMSVQKTMENIMNGSWTVPADFVLHPWMVGVVQ